MVYFVLCHGQKISAKLGYSIGVMQEKKSKKELKTYKQKTYFINIELLITFSIGGYEDFCFVKLCK